MFVQASLVGTKRKKKQQRKETHIFSWMKEMDSMTFPPIIIEVENGVLEDVLSLQMGYVPLP